MVMRTIQINIAAGATQTELRKANGSCVLS